jgi:hypothetical protein
MLRKLHLAALFLILCNVLLLCPKQIAAQSAAPSITLLCNPKVIASKTVASAKQRYEAGQKAEPPLTDQTDGFAWPDTPIGVIKTDNGYEFFASDGGLHSRQLWQGHWYGNNKYGSATRTIGTLDNPLGSGPPIDVTILPNPDPAVNPYYSSYDYMGGGPVYKVPDGMPGAGNLLMVYHAEINTVTTQSFYAVLALATSTDNGMSWTDLGEIIRVNQAYRQDLDGYDIGDPPLVTSPDGKYFYIYFRDWLANGTTHWENTVTLVSVARAPIAEVLSAAFGSKPHAALFQKYYAGDWRLEPGIGGYSTDLNPNAPYSGEVQVAYNADLKRYSMIIGEGALFAYAESPDGLQWTTPVLIHQFTGQPNTYVMPVGMGGRSAHPGRTVLSLLHIRGKRWMAQQLCGPVHCELPVNSWSLTPPGMGFKWKLRFGDIWF